MSEWDKLRNKLKTPEQRQAEAAAEAQRKREEAIAAASEALVVILRAFEQAQKDLTPGFPGSVFVTRGGHGIGLEFPGHRLSAAREGEVIVFGIDSGEIRFEYRDGVFVAEKIVPMAPHEFDEFVARQVKALLP